MSFDTTPSKCMPPPLGQRTDGCKLIGIDTSAFYLAITLAFDPLTLKTFSTMPTHMMAIELFVASFRC